MKDKDSNKLSPLKLFWEIVSSEKNIIFVVVTYEVGVGILSLTIPIGVQIVVNTLAFATFAQPLVFFAFAIFIGQVFGAILKISQVLIIEKLQKRLFVNTGMELAYRLPRVIRQKNNELHELVNRFFDIVTIQKNFSFILLEGFSLTFQIIAGLVLLAFYHPALLAFDVCLVILILVLIFVFGQNAVDTSIRESYEKYNVVSWLEQIASKTITFSSKDSRYFALQRANKIITKYVEARDSHFKVVLRQVIGFLSLHAIANTSLLILGVWLVSSGQLTIGQLVAAEIVVSSVLYSLTRFQKHLDNYYDLIAGIDKVGNLLSLPLEQRNLVLKSSLNLGEIEFINVEYLSSLARRKLGPISFKLNKGERIAIHGSNGTGKSTLIDLIFCLKNPSAGSILFDGADFRNVSLDGIRDSISLIRRAEIVKASIFENILLGNTKASRDEVLEMLNKLGIMDEILSFEQGLETQLSEDGGPLSVSQTKLLMFARALLRKPSLLLVDETIDGLDEETRSRVLGVIFDSSRPFSVIITSQNLEIEKHCDKVINLDLFSKGGSYDI